MGIILIVSIYDKRLWKQFYAFYFFIIISVEIILFLNPKPQFLFNFLDIFSILFWGWIISKDLIGRNFIYMITLVAFISAVYFFFTSQTSYSTYTGVIYSVFCIVLSIIWFMKKINSELKEQTILNFSLFWICSSLLLWSVFYLFRMMPMYWFNSVDKEFLLSLRNIFQVINIVSYSLFLRGLFCKV